MCSDLIVGAPGSSAILVAYLNERIQQQGDCWIWAGDLDHGYAIVNFNKLRLRGTSVVWEVVFGAPPTEFMLHKCDNPPCVRPDHLFDGSKGQNLRDASSKDRLARKLTNSKAAEIRLLYAAGGESYARLAARFGVSKGMVRDVIKNKRWAWALSIA